MIFKATIIFLAAICFSFCLLAQEKKMEREKRIKKEEMPAVINNILDKYITKAKKVKYFEETDIGHHSFEVKFFLHHNLYSVEFDDTGNLEDVEMKLGFHKLEKDLRKNITSHMRRYDQFKIKKTQKQFSSGSQTAEQVIELALQNESTEIVRYEIIVETKTNKSWTTYEMLFDRQGNFISQKEVIGRLEDNILY